MGHVIVTNKANLDPISKNDHENYGYTKYLPCPEGIGGQCTVAIYEIAPGKSNYPYHYHRADTEIFYILEGTGTLETTEGMKQVNPGDLIICEPTEEGAHKLTNHSEKEILSYLEFDTIHDLDVIHYPHTGKVGIMDKEEGKKFLDSKAIRGYYEGE